MSKFLMIENPGVAAVESFTLLGASNKFGTDAIGQFGSGTKFGFLALMRAGLAPDVHCGTLKLSFGKKFVTFDGANHQQVVVKLSGSDRDGRSVNRTEDLSLVLQYGAIDWQDVRLAAREFVSNALDAVGGDATQVALKIVDAIPRAKAGVTRVFIPLDDDGLLQDFYERIGEWFLHFANKTWKTTAIIKKDSASRAKIYRRGVFVRTVDQGEDSLFDYNLNDLALDEARVANDWSVRSAAARAVRQSEDPTVLAAILKSPKVWEGKFDLAGTYECLTAKETEARKAVWAAAQELAIGERGVIIANDADDSLVVGKGYTPVRLPESAVEAAEKFGLRTRKTILTCDEREGRRVDEVTDPAAEAAVKHVWDKLVEAGQTRGETCPAVKSFSQAMTGGTVTQGVYSDGVVCINKAILSGDVISANLFQVCLEELAHHISKATDCSRDFQQYVLELATTLLMAK